MSADDDKLLELLDQALSLAELIGFVTPGAIGLSIGAELGGDLLRVFFGGASASLATHIAAAGDSLVDLTRLVGRSIEADIRAQFLAEHEAQYEAVNKEMQALMAEYIWGQAFEPGLEPRQRENWRTRLREAKQQCEDGGVLPRMLIWLQLRSQQGDAYQLTPLFLFTSVLYLHYCQLALLIEVGEIVEERAEGLAEWQRAYPDGEAPADDPRPEGVFVDADQLSTSPYHRLLVTHAEQLLTIGRQRVDGMRDDLERKAVLVQARADQVQLEQLADGRWGIEDRGTDQRYGPDSESEMRLALELLRGKLTTEIDQRLIQQLNLQHIHPRLVDKLDELLHQISELARAYTPSDTDT